MKGFIFPSTFPFMLTNKNGMTTTYSSNVIETTISAYMFKSDFSFTKINIRET